MTNYRHINYEERIKIEFLVKDGKSIRYIAKELKRSPNTISYELKRNKVRKEYISKKAQHKAYFTRYYSKRDCLKVVLNRGIRNYVDEKLKLGWSPETIAGRLSLKGKSISKKAIYKYVYSKYLEKYLFWNRNKRKTRTRRKEKYLCNTRKFIQERIKIEGSGHYEIDFIVSSKSSYVLMVIVDKVTRKVIAERLQNRTFKVVRKYMFKHLKNAKTITTDNDIAFTKWKKLEQILNTKIYFTKPFKSYEKGLVENTNRWLRIPFPKKTDFKFVSNTNLQKEVNHLNSIPRKILNFKTANEVELEMRVS